MDIDDEIKEAKIRRAFGIGGYCRLCYKKLTPYPAGGADYQAGETHLYDDLCQRCMRIKIQCHQEQK